MENNEEFREGTENGYDYLLHSPDYCSFGIFNHYFVINIYVRIYGMILKLTLSFLPDTLNMNYWKDVQSQD